MQWGCSREVVVQEQQWSGIKTQCAQWGTVISVMCSSDCSQQITLCCLCELAVGWDCPSACSVISGCQGNCAHHVITETRTENTTAVTWREDWSVLLSLTQAQTGQVYLTTLCIIRLLLPLEGSTTSYKHWQVIFYKAGVVNVLAKSCLIHIQHTLSYISIHLESCFYQPEKNLLLFSR